MANRFMDSCDHYAAGNIFSKYSAIGLTAPTIVSGRTVNGLFLDGNSGQTGYVSVTFDEQSTWIVGFAVKVTGYGSIASLLLNGNFQIGIMVTQTGTLQFHDISLNGIGSASAVTVPGGTWQYIEFQATIATSSTAGSCLIKLNGATVLTLTTGVRTNWSNGTTANQVCFGQWTWFRFAANAVITVDDIYINDTTGSADTTFWGDITVDALFTNSVGTYQDFTLFGTSTSVLATTDRAPDGDSTYVFTNTLTYRESFTFTQPTSSILTVFGVQLLNYARKVGSGNRSLTPFTRTSITNYEQTASALSTSYGYTKTLIRLNPATGLAWTEAEIQAIEAGVKVS